jgi:MscS family membrane protein
MPNSQPVDQNLTHIVNVIDSVDLGLADKIQELLNPVYTSKYGEYFQHTIWGIPLANLIFAFFVFLFILVLRHFFTYIVIAFLQNFAKRSKTYYDDRIISALKAPIRFSFIIVALHFFFLLIFKETPFIKNVLNSLMLYTLFWAILAIAEALREIVYKATAKFNDDLSKEMGGFILALIKVLISGIGLAAILQVWGVNVTALIASLGLGGLAFALAAKDTASNLFGSLALLLDRSIRIGEWVKVGGVEGVVEDVGMRTTKIRSFGKALITVPNSIVANSPIENFSRRGIRRIKMHIGLTYSTNSTQLLEIKTRIEQMLKSHEGISQKDSLMVYFDNFGDSSLDIFIYTFTNTANWAKYLETREDINVKIMQIVEECGSSFAFPSQSIYVESLPKE